MSCFAGVAWSAYFTVYEAIKGLYGQWYGTIQGERLPTWTNTASAAQAGALVSGLIACICHTGITPVPSL